MHIHTHTHTKPLPSPEREGACPHPTASQLPDASTANVHLSRAGQPSPRCGAWARGPASTREAGDLAPSQAGQPGASLHSLPARHLREDPSLAGEHFFLRLSPPHVTLTCDALSRLGLRSNVHPCATPFPLPNTTDPSLLTVTCLFFRGLLQQEQSPPQGSGEVLETPSPEALGTALDKALSSQTTLCSRPCSERRLAQTTSKGPFQPGLFGDSPTTIAVKLSAVPEQQSRGAPARP